MDLKRAAVLFLGVFVALLVLSIILKNADWYIVGQLAFFVIAAAVLYGIFKAIRH